MSKFVCVIFLIATFMSSGLFCGKHVQSVLKGESEIVSSVSNGVMANALVKFLPTARIVSSCNQGIVMEKVVVPNTPGMVAKIIDILGVNPLAKEYKSGVLYLYGTSKLLFLGERVNMSVSRDNITVWVNRKKVDV